MKIVAVVVAGGKGARVGDPLPKQLHIVAGKRLLDWSVAAVARVAEHVVVVAHSDLLEEHRCGTAIVVPGGVTRAESVRSGLDAVARFHPTHVLIHDAARPAVSELVTDAVLEGLAAGHQAVIPVVPVTDSLRHRDGGSVDRTQFLAVQTPQGFSFDLIERAHASGDDATDDASLVDALGIPVVHVDGDPQNIKVTVAADLALAEILLG